MCENHAPASNSRLSRRGLLSSAAAVTTASALAVFEAPAGAATRTTTRTFTGTFTGVNTPDWHYLPFRVPAGVRSIHVSYEYPKTDTGLGFSANVIDIGIFDPSGHQLGNQAGFRGWSGGARKSFYLSRTAATPGYIPGPMTPGVWNVILGPVAIVPPGVSWTVSVTLRFAPQGRVFRPTPAPVAVPGTRSAWYRGDMHLHTVHSDGRRTQPELIAAARDAGLDFIGSSEHNTHSAQLSWGQHTPSDFLVINGEEVTTRAGHWIAMGLPANSWVDWRYRPADDQLRKQTARVRRLGGIAFACHPFVPIPSTKWDFGYDYAAMDAVEVWNGPWTHDDDVTVLGWHGLLVNGRRVVAIGNSDSHHEGQLVGLPQTVVRSRDLSVQSIIAGIRAGRAWIAESRAVDLRMSATAPGKSAVGIGSTASAATTDLVRVRLTVTGVPGCAAQLWGATGVVGGGVADGSGRVVVDAQVPTAAKFVRAEVRRLDAAPTPNLLEGTLAGPMVALTNPIWLS